MGDREFGLVENCLTIEEEHRQQVEGKVLEIVKTHPTIAAIRNGEAVTDLATGAVGAYTEAIVAWGKCAFFGVESSQGV